MDKFAGGVSLIPEQDWETADLAASPFGTPPDVASIGFVNGEPAGSANPLSWSAASFVRLFADIGAGRLLDRPRSTFQRYVAHTQGTTPLTVTSPADLSAVTGSPVTVTGTTAPGNAVYVTATNTDANSATTSSSTTADAAGAFSLSVAVTGGTTVLNVVAVSATGGTAHVKRTVVFDFVPGTLLLDVTDPSNDDNGPGNYAYPTSGDFHPGAFDIQQFQVFDDGTNAIFRVKVRDLSPTFGSPLGAQLVDVYVHDPAARAGLDLDAAANASRNFQIAPAYAWSRLIQVQGFGQRYENAAGTPLGTVAISANQISHFITFRVPKASLGSPGPGWAFTVVLTGQDGFSGDQARGFQSTPQDFQFGVCAVASADPHCTVNPGTVPKAVDVIPPAGRPPVGRARLHAAQPGRAAGRHDPLAAPSRRRRFELVDLDLPHLQHRGHDPLGLLLVRIGEQLDEHLRDDLPRHAELVLQPAARALFPTLGERAPERSTSSWLSQLTSKEMASLNVKSGPPFKAMNFWPSSSKLTVITIPSARGPAEP